MIFPEEVEDKNVFVPYDNSLVERMKLIENRLKKIDDSADRRWATLGLDLIYKSWKHYDDTGVLASGVPKPLHFDENNEALTKNNAVELIRDVMVGSKDVILNAKQVSKLLQLHIRTVYKLANDGELPAVKLSGSNEDGSWRFSKNKIMELFNSDSKEKQLKE